MKMKKIGYIAIASLIALSSCSDFLDEELKSSLAPDNTYTSTHGFEVGITGLYEYARSEYNTWGEVITLFRMVKLLRMRRFR